MRDVKSHKQQIAHYDRIKAYATPDQRHRKRRSNHQNSKKTHKPVAVDDNDLVFVDLTDSDVPTQHAAQAQREPASFSITSPSSFSPNQNSSSSPIVPQRPHRAAADHARHPGFFRLAYFDSAIDIECV